MSKQRDEINLPTVKFNVVNNELKKYQFMKVKLLIL